MSLQDQEPGVVNYDPSRLTHQRSIHTLPIGIELLLVYNFTANEDDIGRCPGTAFTDRRDSTVHDHAEIFIAICSVFAGLDICITVEPLDRLLKWRELGYHNALHALILVGVEHLGWTIRDEHIDILGVDRRRLLPVTLESGTVVHRLADINKIARHSIRLLNSLASGSAPRSRCPSQRVNTVFPVVWPAIIEPIASRASAIGITTPTSGWMPAVTMKLIMAFISSSVPMMVPRMLICSTNMRSRSVSATPPVVMPFTTRVPPRFNDRRLCAQVTAPTLSTTASTRRGSSSLVAKTASAPSRNAIFRPSSFRVVTHTLNPAARPIWMSAVAMPPLAP